MKRLCIKLIESLPMLSFFIRWVEHLVMELTKMTKVKRAFLTLCLPEESGTVHFNLSFVINHLSFGLFSHFGEVPSRLSADQRLWKHRVCGNSCLKKAVAEKFLELDKDFLKLKSALSATFELHLEFLWAHCHVIITAKKLRCITESARPFSNFCPSLHLSKSDACAVVQSCKSTFWCSEKLVSYKGIVWLTGHHFKKPVARVH